ncbi:ABC transporter ATP-binding protein [Clostridia bacterium]|nr:ABC transporter ATP-binding protein [Clostridia bacterium]
MKKLLALLIALTMVLSVAAVQADEPEISGTLRVMWWGGDSRHEITLQVIDLFEAQYPNVKIEAEYMGGGDYWTKLDTMLAGGNAPDVLQFGGNYPDYVSKGVLAPLDPYFGNLIDQTKVDQPMLNAITVDGSVYGLCLGANRLGIVYNKTMLDNAGVELPDADFTWETFGEYLAQLKDKLPTGVYPMFDGSCYETNTFGYYTRQQGNSMYTGGDSTDLKVETVKSFLDMWAGWRDAGLVPSGETSAEFTEKGTDTSALVAGKVAMTILYSNQISGYQAAMTDELGISPLPEVASDAAWIMPSQYFCMNSASENKDAAAAFINFFVTTPEVGLILRNDRGISASPEVRTAIAEVATPLDQKVYALFDVLADHSTPMDPNIPNDQEFLEGFDNINLAVAFGQKTTADAAQEILDLLHRMIEKK